MDLGSTLPRYNAVFLVGPSSAGKTTLCYAIIDDLKSSSTNEVVFIEEVARKVITTKDLPRYDLGDLRRQQQIVSAQLIEETEALSKLAGGAGKILIGDRSAVDSIAYGGLSDPPELQHSKRKALVESNEFQTMLRYYRSESVLFILMDQVREWFVDDGRVNIIDDPTYPHFKEIMIALGVQFIEMGPEMKNLEDRVAAVKRWMGLTPRTFDLRSLS
jgi:nicotinamide riboside kinase